MKPEELGKKIEELQNQLHEKNVALDALHWVWCDGGCQGGVHRYNDLPPITDEMIQKAEWNLERMKSWLINYTAKRQKTT